MSEDHTNGPDWDRLRNKLAPTSGDDLHDLILEAIEKAAVPNPDGMDSHNDMGAKEHKSSTHGRRPGKRRLMQMVTAGKRAGLGGPSWAEMMNMDREGVLGHANKMYPEGLPKNHPGAGTTGKVDDLAPKKVVAAAEGDAKAIDPKMTPAQLKGGPKAQVGHSNLADAPSGKLPGGNHAEGPRMLGGKLHYPPQNINGEQVPVSDPRHKDHSKLDWSGTPFAGSGDGAKPPHGKGSSDSKQTPKRPRAGGSGGGDDGEPPKPPKRRHLTAVPDPVVGDRNPEAPPAPPKVPDKTPVGTKTEATPSFVDHYAGHGSTTPTAPTSASSRVPAYTGAHPTNNDVRQVPGGTGAEGFSPSMPPKHSEIRPTAPHPYASETAPLPQAASEAIKPSGRARLFPKAQPALDNLDMRRDPNAPKATPTTPEVPAEAAPAVGRMARVAGRLKGLLGGRKKEEPKPTQAEKPYDGPRYNPTRPHVEDPNGQLRMDQVPADDVNPKIPTTEDPNGQLAMAFDDAAPKLREIARVAPSKNAPEATPSENAPAIPTESAPPAEKPKVTRPKLAPAQEPTPNTAPSPTHEAPAAAQDVPKAPAKARKPRLAPPAQEPKPVAENAPEVAKPVKPINGAGTGMVPGTTKQPKMTPLSPEEHKALTNPVEPKTVVPMDGRGSAPGTVPGTVPGTGGPKDKPLAPLSNTKPEIDSHDLNTLDSEHIAAVQDAMASGDPTKMKQAASTLRRAGNRKDDAGNEDQAKAYHRISENLDGAAEASSGGPRSESAQEHGTGSAPNADPSPRSEVPNTPQEVTPTSTPTPSSEATPTLKPRPKKSGRPRPFADNVEETHAAIAASEAANAPKADTPRDVAPATSTPKVSTSETTPKKPLHERLTTPPTSSDAVAPASDTPKAPGSGDHVNAPAANAAPKPAEAPRAEVPDTSGLDPSDAKLVQDAFASGDPAKIRAAAGKLRRTGNAKEDAGNDTAANEYKSVSGQLENTKTYPAETPKAPGSGGTAAHEPGSTPKTEELVQAADAQTQVAEPGVTHTESSDTPPAAQIATPAPAVSEGPVALTEPGGEWPKAWEKPADLKDPELWNNKVGSAVVDGQTELTDPWGKPKWFNRLYQDNGFKFDKNAGPVKTRGKNAGKKGGAWVHNGTPEEQAAALANVRGTLQQLDDALMEEHHSRYNEAFPPTPEQRDILNAVSSGKDVVVRAMAGTGKTSTLQAIARRMPDKKISYVAFNKGIQMEADRKFPKNVEARTADSHGYGGLSTEMKAKYRAHMTGQGGAISSGKNLAAHFGVGPVEYRGEGGKETMNGGKVATLANKAVEAFTISADDKIGPQHLVDKRGNQLEMPNEATTAVLDAANKFWDDLQNPKGVVRYTNAHATKQWALSKPEIPGDVILFDEAQDINPVLEKVLKDQNKQRIVVGDSNQAIYGFRGATDALDKWQAPNDLPLTQSWRFGPQVAEVGNRFLQMGGSPDRVQGHPGKTSEIGEIDNPDAILTRTNAGAVEALVQGLDEGKRMGLAGGTDDIVNLVESLANLKQGTQNTKDRFGKMPRMHADVREHKSWDDLKQSINDGEGGSLKPIVDIIENQNPWDLVKKLKGVSDESDPRVERMVSTAHKSKGLEWDNVRIHGDFRGPEIDEETGHEKAVDPEELRLAYVAITRAKDKLDPGSLGYVFDRTEQNGGTPAERKARNADAPSPEALAQDDQLNTLMEETTPAPDAEQAIEEAMPSEPDVVDSTPTVPAAETPKLKTRTPKGGGGDPIVRANAKEEGARQLDEAAADAPANRPDIKASLNRSAKTLRDEAGRARASAAPSEATPETPAPTVPKAPETPKAVRPRAAGDRKRIATGSGTERSRSVLASHDSLNADHAALPDSVKPLADKPVGEAAKDLGTGMREAAGSVTNPKLKSFLEGKAKVWDAEKKYDGMKVRHEQIAAADSQLAALDRMIPSLDGNDRTTAETTRDRLHAVQISARKLDREFVDPESGGYVKTTGRGGVNAARARLKGAPSTQKETQAANADVKDMARVLRGQAQGLALSPEERRIFSNKRKLAEQKGPEEKAKFDAMLSRVIGERKARAKVVNDHAKTLERAAANNEGSPEHLNLPDNVVSAMDRGNHLDNALGAASRPNVTTKLKELRDGRAGNKPAPKADAPAPKKETPAAPKAPAVGETPKVETPKVETPTAPKAPKEAAPEAPKANASASPVADMNSLPETKGDMGVKSKFSRIMARAADGTDDKEETKSALDDFIADNKDLPALGNHVAIAQAAKKAVDGGEYQRPAAVKPPEKETTLADIEAQVGDKANAPTPDFSADADPTPAVDPADAAAEEDLGQHAALRDVPKADGAAAKPAQVNAPNQGTLDRQARQAKLRARPDYVAPGDRKATPEADAANQRVRDVAANSPKARVAASERKRLAAANAQGETVTGSDNVKIPKATWEQVYNKVDLTQQSKERAKEVAQSLEGKKGWPYQQANTDVAAAEMRDTLSDGEKRALRDGAVPDRLLHEAQATANEIGTTDTARANLTSRYLYRLGLSTKQRPGESDADYKARTAAARSTVYFDGANNRFDMNLSPSDRRQLKTALRDAGLSDEQIKRMMGR